MSLDPYMAAVAATPKASTEKLCDATRPLLSQFIRAGGRPGDLAAWAAWIALPDATREIWVEEAERVQIERTVALARGVRDEAGLLALIRQLDPDAVAGAEADAALDAAEARDRAKKGVGRG